MRKDGASKKGKYRIRVRDWCVAGLMCAAFFCVGCGADSALRESLEVERTSPSISAELSSDMPGQIKNGVFKSTDGRFTVQADEQIWEVSRLEGMFELRLRRHPACSVTFQESEQITMEQIQQFETVFAPSYAEALKEDYLDVRVDGIYMPRSGLSGMAITMTDRERQLTMRQLFYLAADEKGGCLMTAILPESDDGRLQEDVQALIESFSFQNGTQ